MTIRKKTDTTMTIRKRTDTTMTIRINTKGQTLQPFVLFRMVIVVSVLLSFFLCVCFVDRCLSFCPFSFWSLCCLSFDLRILITPFGIFKLFFIKMHVFGFTTLDLFNNWRNNWCVHVFYLRWLSKYYLPCNYFLHSPVNIL
jgi:hypothetical protein